jgi:hypothetical protein
MNARIRFFLLFLAVLIPSLQFVWQNRDMPEFAYLHDDGVLFVSAQSLASGQGYLIPSLPERPYQAKFPPLYPLYLSAIWHLNPAFPANLGLASWLCWLTLAICLALASLLYKDAGFSEPRRWALTFALGLSPYLILFGSMMFSEVFFTCFVLGTLILAERPGSKAILAAGVLACAAYLTRTAGLALLVSVPLVLLIKRDWRRAAIFAGTMMPAVIGWTLWVNAHLPHSQDLTLLYYADYFGFRAINFGLDNLAVILWKNADKLLYSVGSLVLPAIAQDSLLLKILTQVIAVAMLSGCIRLARKGVMLGYAIFTLVSLGILMIWHYPPTERFVLPLFPLLLAGFFTEMEHLWAMLRKAFAHRDRSQRVVAYGFAGAVGLLLIAAVGTQGFMTFRFLNQNTALQRSKLQDRQAAYQWIAANVRQDAGILSYDDPLLYLYSGRRGNYMPLLPRWWYAEDHQSMQKAYQDVAEYCRTRNLSYFYFTTEDLSRETGDEDRQKIEALVRGNSSLTPVYQSGIGTLFRVEAASSPISSQVLERAARESHR